MRCFFIVLIVAILPFPSLSAAAEKYYVAADIANVRDNPNGAVISKLSRGTAVEVHQVSAGWSRITPSGNNNHWIHSGLLCSTPLCYTAASQNNAPSLQSWTQTKSCY